MGLTDAEREAPLSERSLRWLLNDGRSDIRSMAAEILGHRAALAAAPSLAGEAVSETEHSLEVSSVLSLTPDQITVTAELCNGERVLVHVPVDDLRFVLSLAGEALDAAAPSPGEASGWLTEAGERLQRIEVTDDAWTAARALGAALGDTFDNLSARLLLLVQQSNDALARETTRAEAAEKQARRAVDYAALQIGLRTLDESRLAKVERERDAFRELAWEAVEMIGSTPNIQPITDSRVAKYRALRALAREVRELRAENQRLRGGIMAQAAFLYPTPAPAREP